MSAPVCQPTSMNVHGQKQYLAGILEHSVDDFIQLSIDVLPHGSPVICVRLTNAEICGLLNNTTCCCFTYGSGLKAHAMEITREGILSGQFTWIMLEDGFNTASTMLLFDLLSRGLVEQLKCRNVETDVAQDMIDHVARFKLPKLMLPSHGHHVNLFLQAMTRGDISVNVLIFTSIPHRSIDTLSECISSPLCTIGCLTIYSGVFTRETMKLLYTVASHTWLPKLTLGLEPQIRNRKFCNQLQRLLLAKQQLLTILQSSRRACSVSKLPVELTRMLSTFLI